MRVVWVGLAAVLVGSTLAFGQAQVTVKKGGRDKSALDLSSFASSPSGASGLFRRTLEADLIRSGWFLLASPGAVAVTGGCNESGGELVIRCQTVNAKREIALNKTFQDSSSAARALAHKVSDEIVMALTGCPGIASTKIVMVGASKAGKELFMCDADGENMRQITQDRSISMMPRWSPAGDRLVYTSFRSGYPDVYVIDMASRTLRVLANFPGLNGAGAISPDGQEIALTLSKDGNPELYIMDIDSRRPTRITNTPRAAEASPSWSPDGSQIVFVSDSSGSPHLYLMSRNGGDRKRLLCRGTENVAPNWGKNGLICFSSKREGHYQVCILNPQTMEEQQLTTDYADYEDPCWAPDGRHIACTRTSQYRPAVYILDRLGDIPIRLTTLTGDWYSPAWSPK